MNGINVIFENPGVLRVELIRAMFVQGTSEICQEPFIITYRAPGVASAEHIQLSDELLSLYLSVSTKQANVIRRHVFKEYALSAGALEQLLKAREILLPHIKN